MEALTDTRREKFCQIVALEDCDIAEAAFRAGFGSNSHPKKDAYHTTCASRLMQREDVNLRINTIRQINAEKDKEFTKSMIQRLKDIIEFNPLKYYKSSNVVLPNGRTVTDVYMSTQVQAWSSEDCALVNGFDSRGIPRFIDKQWAFEKLLKIYQLDGKTSVDIEDMLGLFASVGLPVGLNPNINSEPKSSDLTDEDEAELLGDLGDI